MIYKCIMLLRKFIILPILLLSVNAYAVKSTQVDVKENEFSGHITATSTTNLQDVLEQLDQLSLTSAIDDLSDVDTTGKVNSKVLKWNGTNWVPGVAGDTTEFSFYISSFSDGISSTQEIGTGTWKAAGALSFTAAYNFGPAISGSVQITSGVSAWGTALTLASTYQGPTVNTEAVPYRATVGNIVFTLSSATATESDTATQTVTFYNRRYYGTTTKTSGYTSEDIGNIASNSLSNSRLISFSVTAGSGEYIVYAYPTRLGEGAFWAGGFEGGFEDPETVSRTNDSGFTENYYVYRSVNPNLGATDIEVL